MRGLVRRADGSLQPESFYADFLAGLLEIDYDGFLGYELCHPLPLVSGKTVDMKGLIEEVQTAHRARARLAAQFPAQR